MRAMHGWAVAVAFALAVSVSGTGSLASAGDAESLSASHAPADTSPIRFHPADSVIRLTVGTFGRCARDFDAQTRVASIYCPKLDSPDQSEFIFINVYLSQIWTDSFDVQSVARVLRDSQQPGLISESAFAAPARPAATELTYFLVQTHVQPGEAFGNVYLTVVSPAQQAVVAILYGQRFESTDEDLRVRERQWLISNVTTYFEQLHRISLDSSWVATLRSLAR